MIIYHQGRHLIVTAMNIMHAFLRKYTEVCQPGETTGTDMVELMDCLSNRCSLKRSKSLRSNEMAPFPPVYEAQRVNRPMFSAIKTSPH